MRYTLWSRGRLAGHTDLDIYTVTPTMRQGFIEPTPEGRPLLEEATEVWRAMADQGRAKRVHGEDDLADDHELVAEAMSRREALEFELHDEHGAKFDCDFMRVYDLFDLNAGVVDEMGDTEEEEQAEFEVHLSSLSAKQGAEALAERAATEAEIEEFIAELREERDEQQLFGSSWPAVPDEDPRWSTMQYHLQVFLKTCFEDDTDFPSQDFTDSAE